MAVDDTAMAHEELHAAVQQVPAGRWAVGVSGGCDSVALLSLMRGCPDLDLHVVHLDHQTRGADSTADAAFVRELCEGWKLPSTIDVRSHVETQLQQSLPQNPSARYRAMRLALFRRAIESNGLQGVILAHHLDDQVETVLHRLLRGASAPGLAGMRGVAQVAGVNIRRPLLNIPRRMLRDYLSDIGQSWREDSSNLTEQYQRNRLRKWLQQHRQVAPAVLRLSIAARRLTDWQASVSPVLSCDFTQTALATLPSLLAEHSAKQWLSAQGCPPDEISPEVANRLILMASDAAQPPRQYFPGRLLVERKRGMIRAVPDQ